MTQPTKKLDELKARWNDNRRKDLMDETTIEISKRIQKEVLALHREEPHLLTKEDLRLFRIIVPVDEVRIGELIKEENPTLRQQIDFVRMAGKNPMVLRTEECRAMLLAIENNLVTVSNLKMGEECRLCGGIPAEFVPE